MDCRRRRAGTALAAVLIFLMVVSAIMAAMASSLHVLRMTTTRHETAYQAEEAARAGVEHALWVLKRAKEDRAIRGEIGSGQYEVTITPVPDKPGQWEIRAVGTAEGRRGNVRLCRLGAVAEQ